MSRKYAFRDPEGLYFISTAVVFWMDIFTRRVYKDILIDSLTHCVKNKGLIVHAYVIMSNHLHLIISRSSSKNSFSDIIRDFKKYTAMQIIKVIKESPQESRKDWLLKMMKQSGYNNSNNTTYQLWQQHNHPIELESDWIDQKVDYIHNNPVKAGWVSEPHDYYYSSAKNYASLHGPMKVVSVYDGVLI